MCPIFQTVCFIYWVGRPDIGRVHEVAGLWETSFSWTEGKDKTRGGISIVVEKAPQMPSVASTLHG